MKKLYVVKCLLLVVLLGVGKVWGQVNMTTTNSYSQDFNSLITSGSATFTDNSTIANWYSQRTGTGTTYAADGGSSSTGGLYSYGAGTATDRALGTVGSGTAGHFAHGVLLRNTSGTVISTIKVTYSLEEWRNGGNTTANTVTFWYKTSSSTITSLNPNANTTWTQVTALSLSSPINTSTAAYLDGNAVGNKVTASNISIPGLSLADNDYIMLKWEDPDHSGTDHGLAIDDVTVNWTVPAGSTATLANITQPSGAIAQGATDVVLSGFKISANASSDFTGVTVSGSGTATSTDINTVRIFKDNNANGVIDGADASVSGAGLGYAASMSFTISGETGITTAQNYLIVANVTSAGISTVGRTVTASVASGAFVTTANNNFGSATGNARTIALVNDNCSGAINVPVNAGTTCGVTTTGTSVGGTLSSQTVIRGNADDDVWFSFVAAAATQAVTVTPTATGGISDIVFETFSGSCASLTSLGYTDASNVFTDPETRTLTGLTIGNTYFLRIYSYNNGSNQGAFTVCVSYPPPTITTSATALAVTGYNQGFGPLATATSSFTVTGITLTNDISISCPADYEISTSSTAGFGSSITLAQSGGSVATTTIYVRLRGGLATATYNAEVVTVASTGATSKTISNSSTVYQPNNDCAGTIAITVNTTPTCSVSTTGTSVNATQSQVSTSGTSDDDVWYSFIAGSTSEVVTITPGTMVDVVFQTFSGSCALLTSLGYTDATLLSNPETATLTGLTVGNTYYVRVYSYSGTAGQGTFTICVTLPPPTIAVTPTALAVTGYNQGAGPLATAAQSFSVSGSYLTNDISIAAPVDYEISTSSTSGFGSSLSLTQAGGVVNSTTIYVRLKGSLTINAYNSEIVSLSTPGGTNKTVTLSGTVYQTNNDCLGAIALTVNATATSGSVQYSIPSSSLTYAATKNDVWFKYTPACSGSTTFTLTFSATSNDLDLDIFTSSCPSSGSASFTEHTTANPTILTSTLVGGTTYYVRVIDYNTTAIPFTIGVTSSVVPPTFSTQPTPTSATTYPGAAGTTSYTATASAGTYQWQYSPDGTNGWVNVTNGTPTGFAYLTPTSNTLGITTTAASPLGTYYYRAVATASSCPGYSNNATFTLAQPPTPTTTSISPNTATAGDPAFTITVNGTNFLSSLSTVTWNGSVRTTTFVSASQLTASILASDITTVGTFPVGVTTTNAAAASNTQPFSVTPASNPTVTTNTAPGLLGAASATLGGSITDPGTSSVVEDGIVYSLTSTNATPAVSGVGVTKLVAATIQSGAFNASTVVALTPNSQYSYRAYATNNGTSYAYGGTTGTTFYTLANTPAAPTVDGATSISLNVTVNVNSNPANTEFAIYETTTGKYVQADGTLGATAVWQTATAWGTKTVKGLNSQTSYTFEVKARNTISTETAFGPIQSAITLACPSVSNLIVSGITNSGANVSWTGTASVYEYSVTTSSADPANGSGTIDSANTDFAGGLAANTNYYLHVHAKCGTGYSPWVTSDPFTTDNAPTGLITWVPGAAPVQSNYGVSPFTPTTSDSRLTVTGLTRGSAVSTNIVGHTAAASAWGGYGWDGTANKDVRFTLKANTGYVLSLSSLQLSYRKSTTGPTTGALSYSLDGANYVPITTWNFSNSSASGSQLPAVSLSGFAPLQNVASGTTLYFKIIPTGGGTDGTWYLFNEGLLINGIISPAIAPPVATAATNVNPSCFTANWGTVTGAASYLVDVYVDSSSVDPNLSTVAGWNFETNLNSNSGVAANIGKAISAAGTTNLAITSETARADGWDAGSGTKYWEIAINTNNFYNIKISSAQRSSNTGPRDFKLQYKIGSGTYADVPGGTIPQLADNYTSGVIANLSLPVACENVPVLYLRWIMTSNTPAVTGTTVASLGGSNIDDIVISGNAGLTTKFVYKNLAAGNATSLVVTGLTPATKYYYVVRAVTSGGINSNNSNVIALITTALTSADYVSKQSGNYSDATTWAYDPGCGAPFVQATTAPGAGNNVTIMASHIVTLDANSVISTGKTLTINSAGSLIMNDKVLSGAGAFTLSPGSILSIGSVNGIALTSATGNVQTTGTRSYSTGADYTYAGTAPQITGDGLPATVHNLNINNTTGVTSTNGIGIGDSMTMNGLFTPLAGQVISGAGLLTGTGTVKVTRATGSADFVGQYSISNKTLINLIVDFAGASAQGVSANTFGGLTVTNPSGVIMSGNVAIGNVLNLPTATLAINGNILTANGTITGSGKLKGSSTSELVVNGTGTFGTVLMDQSTDSITNVLKALTVNRPLGSVTLGNRLYITDVLTPTDGNLISNGNLTIRSTSIAATARVAALGASASVTGNVTVERFFTKRRAYRFISPSVNNSTATGTIKANWMEGVNNPNPSINNNPNPGYGVQISGAGGATNGFDPTNTNNPSLYTFNNNSQMWNAFPNTGGLLIEGSAWRLFSRGGRATNLTINAPDSSTTIIRATGALNAGTFIYNTTSGTNKLSSNPSDYNLIGNPYASPVSWLSLVQPDPVFPHASTGTAFHILPSYTAWDLNIGKRGSYVTYNGVSGVNSVTASEVNNLIQPGQAFFIQNAGTSPSLQFQEAFKSNGANTRVYRTSADTTKMSVQLLYSNSGSTQDIADALVAVFDDNFSKAIGNEDSYKFPNTDENIAINENGTSLSIEGRPNVNPNDTMFLKIWQLRQKTYYLSIDAQNFSPAANAYLKDLYLNQETSIDLSGNTLVPFSLTADSASFASNRFMILFRPSSTLPVTVTDVKAYRKDKDIQVEWTVQTEKNILRYEVEKSPDGRNFEKAGSIASKGNNAGAFVYSWLDEHVNPGYHFYRIKVIDKSGSVSYTKTVKVLIAGDAKGIAVFPNPVKSNIIGLQLNDLEKGKYNVVLYNNLGQKLYSTVIEHAGGSAYYKIVTGIVSKGSYRLSVNNGGELLNAALIFE